MQWFVRSEHTQLRTILQVSGRSGECGRTARSRNNQVGASNSRPCLSPAENPPKILGSSLGKKKEEEPHSGRYPATHNCGRLLQVPTSDPEMMDTTP